MKTTILVIVAFILGSFAAIAAQVARPRHVTGVPITEAIYFRDAYGRCLRLQPQLAQDGTLMVIEIPSGCVKREATR